MQGKQPTYFNCFGVGNLSNFAVVNIFVKFNGCHIFFGYKC